LSQVKKRSPLWYELPLLFAIVGGAIAYFKIKKDDPKKARNCLIIGIILTVPLMIILGFIGISGTDNPFYVVSSGSMVPELEVYDIMIVDGILPFEETQVGDIIVFIRPSGHDRVIVARVADIIDDEPFTLRTKGDANPASIPGTDFPITEQEYIGQVVSVIPQVGAITQILRPPVSYIMQIGILMIPVILHIRFKRRKLSD